MSPQIQPDRIPTEFEPDDRIGDYRVERLHAVGGMAHVYLARHVTLGKRVAIKVLQPHARQRADLRARFLREGQAASRIRNNHVVEIYDVGSEGDIPYLVMEYLEGPTLEEYLGDHGHLDVQDAVHIFLPIVAAVAAGHEEGVIHRDLKPENVILAVDGRRTRPTVLDFGVSRLITSDPRLTLDSSVVGTPHFMSPEQARGERIDTKTDQYALGVMLYQALTGRLPRDRASVLELLNEVGHKGFEPPTKHRPGLSPDFEQIVLTTMAPRRQDRFPMMLDLAAALLPFASEKAAAFWSEELGIRAATEGRPKIAVESVPVRDPAVSAVHPRTELITTLDVPRPKPKSRAALYGIVGALIALVLAGGAFAALTPSEPVPAHVARFDAHVVVTPAHASIEIDGETLGSGEVRAGFPVDGTAHHLRVSADGYASREVVFRDSPPPPEIQLARLDPASDETPTAAASEAPAVETPASEAPASEAPASEAPAVESASGSAGRSSRRPSETARSPSPAPVEEASAPAPRAEPAPTPAPTDTWGPRSDRTDNLDPWQ